MEWKLFFTTFLTIFIAEIGDKTQFAAMAASSGTDSTKTVLLAVILALGLAGTIGVLAGKIIGIYLDPSTMKWVSGSLFIIIGLWIFVSR